MVLWPASFRTAHGGWPHVDLVWGIGDAPLAGDRPAVGGFAGHRAWAAPDWDAVTCDGDLAYLPAWAPSVVGQRLTEAAFPNNRARSQIALIVTREGEALRPADLDVADELAQRFHLLYGAASAQRGRALLREADGLRAAGRTVDADAARQQGDAALQSALASFDEAIRLHEPASVVRHNRALVRSWLGQLELANEDRAVAWKEQAELRRWPDTILPEDAGELPLVDVWTRHNEVFGSKLRSADRQAQLVILQLSNEFMATHNIRVLNRVEWEVESIRRKLSRQGPAGLTIGISGSAAVGGDMLRCAAESIRNTESLTIVLVVAILLVVYRAPLLVLVPLLTIFVALSVSTGVLALLAQ